VACLAALLAAGGAGASAAKPSFDYLYIRANEGQSSGGHAAIRFGEWVFDFQYHAGLVQLRRERWGRFEYDYRTLQNRGMELSRIAVSSETWALLESSFQRHYLAQSRELAHLDAIQRDARLIELLHPGRRGEPLELPAVGFFEGEPPLRSKEPQEPAVLVRLRDRVAEWHGRDYATRRRAALDASFRRLHMAPAAAEAATDPDLRAAASPTISERYTDHLLALAALERLEYPTPLGPGRRLGERRSASDPRLLPPAGLGVLEATELARLREASEGLLLAMARLAASSRPDWGRPFLLGMARLLVLEESLDSGRLVLLDGFSADAELLEITGRRRALLPGMAAEASAELEAVREAFFEGHGWSEAEYQALEEAASRWFELRAALAGASRIRVQAGPLIPEGRGRVGALPRPPGDAVLLARRLAETRAAERRYRSALEDRYGYDLFRRNCVSEIFRTLESALLEGADAPPLAGRDRAELVRAESRRRLGGHVDPVAGLNFIPRVSSRHVRSRYAVVEAVHLPSYRHHQMARMAESETALRVALRESNVLTSTLYQPSHEDGFFLFFTDGEVPLRPLLGALNLVAGLTRGALGVLLLPFDGSRSLRSGLEGALFSVPELFFQNVRKGSNEWVSDAELPPPG